MADNHLYRVYICVCFALVLLQLISMHHSIAQELTLLMVSCMTCVAVEVCSAEVHAARSSACREFMTVGGRVLTLSFTYRRNGVGERTLPCGTPSLSLISLLRDPSSFTLAVLWEKESKLFIRIIPCDTSVFFKGGEYFLFMTYLFECVVILKAN